MSDCSEARPEENSGAAGTVRPAGGRQDFRASVKILLFSGKKAAKKTPLPLCFEGSGVFFCAALQPGEKRRQQAASGVFPMPCPERRGVAEPSFCRGAGAQSEAVMQTGIHVKLCVSAQFFQGLKSLLHGLPGSNSVG